MSISNQISSFLVGKLGLNFQGTMVLTTRGRKSGEPRSVVVNPLELAGHIYLMSPRGETDWVKNLRADSSATLHRGSTRTEYMAVAVVDDEVKFRVLRAYLDRWSGQVKGLMGVSKDSSDDELRAIIGKHPVFVLTRK